MLVQSLLDDTSAGRPPDVVVVDNGSSDGSAAAVGQSFPL
jgi:GT2 family glycosyltransferase